MTPFKSKFCNLPFTSMVTRMLLAFLLVSCAQGGDQQGHITNVSGEDNFSSPLPTQLQKLRPGLTAKVVVDKGSPAERTIDLQVDTQNDRVQGTIPDLPVGSHTFEIQYFIDGVLVATATVNANIQAGAATPVPFESSSFVFPDTDGDGASNLNEVEIFGSASNAWNDAATKPTVSVVLNPEKAILPPNGVQTFTAAIAQNANQGVTWSVEGGDPNGTITPSGTYTAPVTPGPYNVIATSQADPTKSATVAVEVVNPGTLDTAFGAGGTVTTTTNLGSVSEIADLAVQPDGKIIAVGISNASGANQFTLARYNSDGTLDTTFGTSNTGIVTTPIGTSSFARAVALQTDGKIVVGGDSVNQFALARYNPDGTLDTTFDTDGIVNTAIGTSSFGLDLVIQTDGKIVLAGQSNGASGTTVALARYNANGSPDTTFDTDGIVAAPAGEVRAVALQSDGRIIVSGRSASHFFLARYNADGSPDTTFDTDGIVTTTIGTGSFATDLEIQPDGKIIAAGSSTNGTTTNLALARYNADGSPDTTFDTDGIVTTTIGSSSIFNKQAVALQTDGKIIMTGPLALARFDPNGTLDSTFDADGILAITIGTGGLFHNMALQADGKVIVGGQLSSHFTLGRFQTAAPAVLLRATLSGDQEVPPVATTATGSATFVINPGQTEITYTLSVPVSDINKITGVQVHLGTPGVAGRSLFTLTTNTFVSPLTGKLNAADLDPTAGLGGVNTFSDTIKAMLDGNTNIHIHTTAHQSGEIRGQILVPPPTLSSLQAKIFSPKCASCHNPGGGTGGATANLFLDSRQTSFENLVNVQSTEAPSLKRVEPGNPNASYVIHKLEGTAVTEGGRCCADQMPLGGPFLSTEEVKGVRDWISGGAKND